LNLKTKKLCALILSLVLSLSCFASIPFAASATTGVTYMAKLNYNAKDTWTYLQTEMNLEKGPTFQFDVDYATEGSVTARVVVRSGSTIISQSDENGHITVQFTWAGSGNFQLQLRDNNFIGTGSVYFANPVLKKVENGELTGDNLVWDFSKQYTDVGSTVTTAYGWNGRWYRNNASANATFTVEPDSNGLFAKDIPGEVIPDVDDFGTQKMFTISPNNSGETKYANVFIPLNFTETAGAALTGTCYFRLTFKAKLLGDQLPIVGVARYQSWSPYGAQSEYNYANNNQKEHSDTVLMSSYDPSTLTFTAIIKLYLTNTHPDTGVHSFITIGNMEHNNTWYDEKNFQAYFAFTDPKLYAYDTTENEVYGSNLIMPVAANTVCLSPTYKFDSNGYSASDSFVAAPANQWCIDTTASLISCTDIPEGYFDTTAIIEGEPKMLRLAGAKSTTNQQALALETHLDANKTYQFDLDYRAFGGVSPLITIQTAAEGGSYSSTLVPYTNTASNVTGAHRSVRFTMPANARSGNNFKVYIGQQWPLKNTGVVYFANASLCEVSGNTLGNNLFTNGDFHNGSTGIVTSLNANTLFSGWGQIDVLNYPSVAMLPIPTDFFTGTAVTGDNTIALTMNGGNYPELQFKTELKANKYYRLSFDYRNIGKMPRLDIEANGTVTSTKVNEVYGDKNCMVYELYSDENNTTYSGSGNDANTRIRLKFGASSSNKTLYINDVQLYELTGHNGSKVGTNLVGNLNPTLDTGLYGELEDVADTVSVKLTQDGTANISRDVANGWFGSTADSTNANAALIKVPDNFFTYYSYAERLKMMADVLLGRTECDNINPYYNPNNDSTWCDIIDYVYTKKQAAGYYNEVPNQFTINGNDVSQYRMMNDGGKAEAFNSLCTAVADYVDLDLQTTSTMPSDGKVIRLITDISLNPNTVRVSVTDNTLTVAAYRAEFTPKAVASFASMLTGTSVSLASGYSRDFEVDTVAYSSATGTKSIIGGSTADSVGYTAGQTATIRLAAADLNNAKILSGVSYLKIHTYNESTRATSDSYITPTNNVFQFTVTANSAGFVFWYALACDSSKNQISAFSTVDDVSGTKYNFAGSVGFNISSINVSAAKPSDFNTYWQNVASGIGSTSGATLTEQSANSGYKAYLVKIPCGTDINGNQGYATGYLTYPTSASASSKIKMQVNFQSYGVAVPSKTYIANTAVFNVCAHSMDLTSQSSIDAYKSYQSSTGFNATASSVDKTYYYQMIRRDLTAAKFMVDYFGTSGNNYWNGTDFEAKGTSMGGFQSTAVAALLKYATANGEGINYLNVELPYMCDMNGENNGRMPRFWGARYGSVLKYFDTAYFGSMVTCKARIYAGLGDSICPASGTTSLYNGLGSTDKTIVYEQNTTHSGGRNGTQFVRTTN
jgi:cephalosporin-C deacetylase-like acetyl esterase